MSPPPPPPPITIRSSISLPLSRMYLFIYINIFNSSRKYGKLKYLTSLFKLQPFNYNVQMVNFEETLLDSFFLVLRRIKLKLTTPIPSVFLSSVE